MSLQPHQAIAGALQVAPRNNLARFSVSYTGTLTRIFIKTDTVNNNGDAVFDVRYNGATLFPVVADRPKILSGAGFVLVANLNVAVVEGNPLAIDLISVPAGGIGGTLTMVVTIDDGLSYTPNDNPLSIETFVKVAYGGPDGTKGAFARAPTVLELTNGTDTLTNACNGATFLSAATTLFTTTLFGSAEYIARARTNAQYVSDLYTAVLGRNSDTTGQNFWEAELTGGKTRAKALLEFLNSDEYLGRVTLYCRTVSPLRSAALDPEKTLVFAEHFYSGQTSAGASNTGGLGLTASSTGFLSGKPSETNHPGIMEIGTGAVSGTVGWVANTRGTTNTGTQSPADYFDLTFIMRLLTNDANTLVRLGLVMSPISATPNDGIYIEKLDADTAWHAVCRAASVQTRVAIGVNTSLSWAKLRIRRVSVAAIAFSVNDGAEVQITTNIPAIMLSISALVRNSAAVNKSFDIDLIKMYLYNLVAY